MAEKSYNCENIQESSISGDSQIKGIFREKTEDVGLPVNNGQWIPNGCIERFYMVVLGKKGGGNKGCLHKSEKKYYFVVIM